MTANGQILSVAELTPRMRDAMFTLMLRYFDGMQRNVFDADLAEKQWVIAINDPEDGRLCGFSTQMLLHTVVAGQKVRALFSGDTIVDRDHWARNPLAGLWGRFALALMQQDADCPLYWFLISKGYKTYRFLPVFFHEFYPRAGTTTPDAVLRALRSLGEAKFPTAFDPKTGIILTRCEKSCRLRAGVAEVTSRRLADPNVRFFCERNPGHADGDELCCLAPLSRQNFTPAAWKVIRAAPSCPWPDSLLPVGSVVY